MNNKRGFTLIELLVVIAIIGILSSVVLASLNSARDKGVDAAIKSTVGGMRAQAAIFYDSNQQNYGVATSDCTTTADTLFTAASENSLKNLVDGVLVRSADVRCKVNDAGDAFIVAAQLKTDPNTYYCVDVHGASSLLGNSQLDNALNTVSCLVAE